MKKTTTIDLKGKPYAKVPERIKIFREDCPNGKIETDHKHLDGDIVEFRAWVWKDKKDLVEILKAGVSDKEVVRNSSDSNGTSKNIVGGEKDFEKLETIAIGRALATLGYLASGEIASSEEMEEFLSQKEFDRIEKMEEIKTEIDAIETIEELKIFYTKNKGLGKDFDAYVTNKKKQLQDS